MCVYILSTKHIWNKEENPNLKVLFNWKLKLIKNAILVSTRRVEQISREANGLNVCFVDENVKQNMSLSGEIKTNPAQNTKQAFCTFADGIARH